MCCCGFSVSCYWRDSVVFNLDGLPSSLKIGLLNPMFVFYLFLALLYSIQVPLAMKFTSHFLDSFHFFLLGSLTKFPIWPIPPPSIVWEFPFVWYMLRYFWILALELMEGVGYILWYGEFNSSFLIIVSV